MKKNLYSLLCLFFLCGSGIELQAQIITTMAGYGIAGYSGDGGPATGAMINGEWGAAIDGAGNMYIGDRFNNRIRKITHSGIITTIAGTGASGFGGDGGPATAALLYQPAGVAVDSSGNVYIADCLNQCVRAISTSGRISTIAGTGTGGYTGDGGAATIAKIDHPGGICIDKSGNIYFTDMTNNCVRKVNTLGIISTYAGNGVSGFEGDGSPATDAQFSTPNDISVDRNGNVYISDFYNNRVRKVDTFGIITTIMGTASGGYSGDGSAATATQLLGPGGIAFDVYGNIYIADADNHRIRKINSAGIVSTISGTGVAGYSGDGGPATAAQLDLPCHILFDINGNMYVTDGDENRIREILNRPPFFTSGDSPRVSVCENTSHNAIDSLLAAVDSDAEQIETWSLLLAPTHGTAIITESMVSTGDILHPSGLSYSPATGYIGIDSFIVSVTDGYDADTATVHVTVTACALGETNFASLGNETIKLFPNPSHDELTITFTDKITQIAVTNLLGQKVFTHGYNSEQVQINVADLPASLYFIKINGSETRKFVKD